MGHAHRRRPRAGPRDGAAVLLLLAQQLQLARAHRAGAQGHAGSGGVRAGPPRPRWGTHCSSLPTAAAYPAPGPWARLSGGAVWLQGQQHGDFIRINQLAQVRG
jgi:hypothetical protein